MNSYDYAENILMKISWKEYMHRMVDAYIAQQPLGSESTPSRPLIEQVEALLVQKMLESVGNSERDAARRLAMSHAKLRSLVNKQ